MGLPTPLYLPAPHSPSPPSAVAATRRSRRPRHCKRFRHVLRDNAPYSPFVSSASHLVCRYGISCICRRHSILILIAVARSCARVQLESIFLSVQWQFAQFGVPGQLLQARQSIHSAIAFNPGDSSVVKNSQSFTTDKAFSTLCSSVPQFREFSL